jgi:PAS domain S-box-containing protein
MSTIKLGVLSCFTGVAGCHGDEIAWAARLACDEVNAMGGIGERELELVIADEGSEPEQAVSAARRLLELGCIALVGGLLPCVRLALVHRVAEVRRIPLLSFAPAEGGIRSRYLFQFGALPNQQLERMVPVMVARRGRRMFMTGCADEWGRGAIAASKRALARCGGEFAGKRLLPLGQLDASATALDELLDTIAAAAPDVLLSYFVGLDQLALVRRIGERGMSDSFTLVAGHFDERLASMLSPAQRAGVHACNSYFMSIETAESQRVLAELGARVDPPWAASQGLLTHLGESAYVCVRAFGRAAARVASSGASLCCSLGCIEVQAPRGLVRMTHDTQHATVGTMLARCEADGRFTILDTFEPVQPRLAGHGATRCDPLEGSTSLEEGLLARLSVAIVLVRALEGVVVHANAAALRLLGCDAPPLGHTLVAQGTGALPQLDARDMPQAYAHAPSWCSDVTLLRADGSRTLVEVVGSAFTHPLHGEVWCLECRNVEALRGAERALQEREDRYRRAELATGEGLWEWCVDGDEHYLSPRWLELVGYEPGERPSSEGLWALMHPDDRARVPTHASLREGTTYDVDVRLRHRQGDYRWFRSRSVVTRDRGGLRLTGTISDISARKRMELRWQQAERLANLGTFDHDLLTNQLWWSLEQRRIQGFGPDEPITQPLFLSLIHPDDREAFDAVYQQVFERDSVEATFRILRPDGCIRYIHGIAMIERDAEGRPSRMLGTNQDVTDAVEATRAQQRALREKDELLREIHHRVKNNLAIVSSLLHFHAERLESARDANTLAQLCRRIKAMSLAHDQLERSADFGRVRMADYLTELAAQLRAASASDASIVIDADPVALPVQVATPIGQILSELLANALMFGCVRAPGRIRVMLHEGADALEFAVEDGGPGFPAGFEPERDGSFGWLLVRMLTKQLGGRVEIESREGARVRIRVPHRKSLD